MTQERTTDWDEVGRRFGELGRRLQAAWEESRAEKAPTAGSEGGAKAVAAAVDDLKSSITRTVSAPEVREAADRATTGLAESFAFSLRQLADWVEQRRTGDAPTGTGTGTADGPPAYPGPGTGPIVDEGPTTTPGS